MPKKGWKYIGIHEEKFWKLMELKVKLRAKTWNELVDKLYEMVMKEGH